MGDSERVGEPQDVRRRRISFRAWHRGIRETDLILGRFADAHLGTLTETELNDFERLLELPDPDILAWVTGMETDHAAPQSHLLNRIIAFHHR